MNRIRELPENSRIVATHTDSPDVRMLSNLPHQDNFEISSYVSLSSLVTNVLLLKYSIQVLIWDVEAQPHRQAMLGATASCPDLVCSEAIKFYILFHITLF